MTAFLVVYRPLIHRRAGRVAAERFGLPLFLDGSCRREPDFEAEFPSISALCRGKTFAPRLRIGDVAVYLATKRRYGGDPASHWRLTAVLRVQDRFDGHEQAAEWCRAQGLPLPSNCMIKGNPPVPYEQTVQDSPEETWDRLVAGLVWPPIGVAAAAALVCYFAVAVCFHVRADDARSLPTPAGVAL